MLVVVEDYSHAEVVHKMHLEYSGLDLFSGQALRKAAKSALMVSEDVCDLKLRKRYCGVMSPTERLSGTSDGAPLFAHLFGSRTALDLKDKLGTDSELIKSACRVRSLFQLLKGGAMQPAC